MCCLFICIYQSRIEILKKINFIKVCFCLMFTLECGTEAYDFALGQSSHFCFFFPCLQTTYDSPRKFSTLLSFCIKFLLIWMTGLWKPIQSSRQVSHMHFDFTTPKLLKALDHLKKKNREEQEMEDKIVEGKKTDFLIFIWSTWAWEQTWKEFPHFSWFPPLERRLLLSSEPFLPPWYPPPCYICSPKL